MRFFILKAAKFAAWFLATVITVLSLIPPGLRPETWTPHDLEHFAIFGATGVTFGVGYYRRSKLAMVALVIFAVAIEFAQIFVPGRHARLSDFIVDAVAVCVSVPVGSIIATRILEQSA